MEIISVLNQNYHLQGFSSDKERNYMHWSFTDSLVKTNINGTMIAQVHISGGHLGDVDYYDGKIYASYLGNALPGHAWDDWTSFYIYVFDASDLRLIDKIRLVECERYNDIAGQKNDTRGFLAIDGVAFGKDPETGERKMHVACAVMTDERFPNQIVLQYNLDGIYEKEFYINTGNTVFGIQNLDYDDETGHFWFTTYNAEKPFQAKNTLYKIDSDLKTILEQYPYSTPYGFECLGGGKYYASAQSGVNGKRNGFAYLCDQSFFSNPKNEKEINDFIKV